MKSGYPTSLATHFRPRIPHRWREPFDAFWSARNPREQTIIGNGSVVLVLVFGYLLLWEPAAVEGARLTRKLPVMRADLAEMETLAQEARGLSANRAPSLRGDALTQALQDSLRQHGLKASRPMTTGDYAIQLHLDKAPFGSVANWLQDVRLQQRLKVTDAPISYVGATALVNATVTLEGPEVGSH